MYLNTGVYCIDEVERTHEGRVLGHVLGRRVDERAVRRSGDGCDGDHGRHLAHVLGTCGPQHPEHGGAHRRTHVDESVTSGRRQDVVYARRQVLGAELVKTSKHITNCN